MSCTMELGQKSDGSLLAEVLELPGVLAYGATWLKAVSKTEAFAMRVIAEQIEYGKSCFVFIMVSIPAA